MRSILRTSLYLTLGAFMTANIIACSDNDNGSDWSTEKEETLKAAVEPYVDNTVISTYKKMADASITLNTKCQTIKEAFNKGTLTTEMVKEAGTAWVAARKYWELSEAFLYGPADHYNIDPHIDSWPMDKVAVLAILNNKKQMALIEEQGVSFFTTSQYGLLGFHAVEYFLFELDATEDNSQPRSISKFTAPEVVYLAAVATDLCNQCIRLEASWANINNVTQEKKTVLTNAQLLPDTDYGFLMKNPGQGVGNKFYKNNFQECAQEIIQGCIDIADEVGNQKIGRPVNGSSSEDKDYIESPYCLNSIVDFADNIVSIQNSYQGSIDGDASLSDYVKTVDADLDTRVKTAIKKAIETIQAIPEPFTKSAKTSAKAKEAVTVVGTDLVDVLEEVNQALSKY